MCKLFRQLFRTATDHVRCTVPPKMDHELTPVTCMAASRNVLLKALGGGGTHVYRDTMRR